MSFQTTMLNFSALDIQDALCESTPIEMLCPLCRMTDDATNASKHFTTRCDFSGDADIQAYSLFYKTVRTRWRDKMNIVMILKDDLNDGEYQFYSMTDSVVVGDASIIEDANFLRVLLQHKKRWEDRSTEYYKRLVEILSTPEVEDGTDSDLFVSDESSNSDNGRFVLAPIEEPAVPKASLMIPIVSTHKKDYTDAISGLDQLVEDLATDSAGKTVLFQLLRFITKEKCSNRMGNICQILCDANAVTQFMEHVSSTFETPGSVGGKYTSLRSVFAKLLAHPQMTLATKARCEAILARLTMKKNAGKLYGLAQADVKKRKTVDALEQSRKFATEDDIERVGEDALEDLEELGTHLPTTKEHALRLQKNILLCIVIILMYNKAYTHILMVNDTHGNGIWCKSFYDQESKNGKYY